MPILDDLFAALQGLLSDLGIEVDIGVVRGGFWIVLTGLVLVLVYRVLQLVYRSLRAAFSYARGQVERKFWRETGKVSTLITFGLLVTAYAFYGQEQTRSIGEALVDLGREQLNSVMPLAILTQFLLLGGFWLLFGRLLGVPFRKLLQPGSTFLVLILATVQLVFYTVALFAVIDGESASALGAVAAMAALSYLTCVIYASPELRVRQRQASSANHRRGRLFRLMWGDPTNPGSRWRRPVGEILLLTAVWFVIFGFLTLVALTVYATAELELPSLAGAIQGELIVMSILLLLWCYYFRSEAREVEGVPPSLFPFADLSFAFAACLLALTSLPGSAVTLGPVPVWLVAVGPALIVAGMVYVIHVRPHRTTPRWAAGLAATVVAGLLVLPAKALLTTALAPVVQLLPLPA